MDSHIALIGSIIIGTMLFLSILSFQSDFKEHSYKQTYDLIAQDHALGIIQMIDSDFKDIGYGATGPAFKFVGSDSVIYYADIDDDANMDSVCYAVGAVSAASSTPNPNDRILTRLVNNQPTFQGMFGVRDFTLRYFDETGAETNVLADIKTIEVSLMMESTEPHDGEYSTFFWREKFSPPSLNY